MKCGSSPVMLAFGTNNHCKALVDEAARALPNKEIGCILRIDTSLSRPVEIIGNLVSIGGVLKEMATNSKAVHDGVQRSKFNHPTGRVWRLDEKAGVVDLELGEWKKLSKL